MKMDTKIQAKENIFDKNQGFWIYNWWNSLKLILNWYGFGYIEPTHSQIFHIDISFERTRLVAERFIAYLIDKYDKHPISKDGGTWYYPPQACQFLQLDHHIHSFYEASLIGRTMQYIKDKPKNALMIIFHAKERNVN